MPIFRIVYIDDDTFAPRTLTADFADRATAEIAMARHGHRVVHMAELAAGESATDPIRVPMAGEDARQEAHDNAPRGTPAKAPKMRFGPALYELAGGALAIVAAGIAYLLL